MKLLLLADIDDLAWPDGSGQADLVISCGDVADEVILQAAKAYGCTTIFAVKGNHDSTAPFTAPIRDLHLRVETVQGVRFGGFNGSWKYKPKGHFLYEQNEAAALLAGFPPVDVLVCHNSPRGIHDRDDEVHTGFDALNAYVARHRPRLLVHGHQHVEVETTVGATRAVGVFGWRVVEA